MDNRVRVRGELPPAVARDIQEDFEHRNPAYHRLKKQGFTTGDESPFIRTWRQEPGELSVPRGGQERVRAFLRRAGVPCRWVDRREGGEPVQRLLEMDRALWGFQEEMLAAAVADAPGVLLQAGTGSGKTQVGIAVVTALNVPVLVVVHNGALMSQWVKRACRELGLQPKDIGQIGGGKHTVQPVTVALHQTLARPGAVTEEMRRYFGAVVVDEVHRYAAPTALAAVDPFPARVRVGLTADHTRKDGKHPIVRDLFGEVAMTVTREQLVAAGHVLDVEVCVVPTDFRAEWYLRGMERAHTGNGWRGLAEKLQDDLSNAQAADKERNLLALHCVLNEHRRGERVIVMARRRDHCRALDLELAGAAVKAGYLVGGKGDAAVFERTVRGLEDGTVRVGIGTIEALGTGIDLPQVAAAVVATPVGGNRQLLNQITGRICRKPDGKDSARLYYLWDQHVNRSHLANLVKWNRVVRVLTGEGWVDGRAVADGGSFDLSPRGITKRLSNDDQPRRPTRMRSRKPAAAAETPTPQAPVAASDRTEDLFNRPQSSANLAADPSALHIALKAKAGWSPGVDAIKNWPGEKALSAAAWALGKLEEQPQHTKQPAVGGDTRVSPPASSTVPLESDLSMLVGRLALKKVHVRLTEIARWGSADQAAAARWCEGLADKPAFLTPGFENAAAHLASANAPADVLRESMDEKQAPPPTQAVRGLGTSLRAVWGEEKITLVPNTFCMCSIGPFEESVYVPFGDDVEQAHSALLGRLAARAEKARGEKLASFARALVASGAMHAVPK